MRETGKPLFLALSIIIFKKKNKKNKLRLLHNNYNNYYRIITIKWQNRKMLKKINLNVN